MGEEMISIEKIRMAKKELRSITIRDINEFVFHEYANLALDLAAWRPASYIPNAGELVVVIDYTGNYDIGSVNEKGIWENGTPYYWRKAPVYLEPKRYETAQKALETIPLSEETKATVGLAMKQEFGNWHEHSERPKKHGDYLAICTTKSNQEVIKQILYDAVFDKLLLVSDELKYWKEFPEFDFAAE